MWFRLANQLGLPVQWCQRATTSREFVEWQDFETIDMNTPSRVDYYLAQIAMEIRRTVAKKPELLKLSDFILKFEESKAKVAKGDPEQRLQVSKAAWAAMAGKPVRKG